MNKIIIPTGYMGSGSSAVTDLISEYKGYEASNGSFEYVFLHCPNGMFDLEDKLLKGNNAVRSDEALHSFEAAMEELYSRKFWWPGNYKKRLSVHFMEYTREYIESITEFKPEYYWYYQERLTFPMFLKMCLRKVLMLVSAGNIQLKRPLSHSPMRLSMPKAEDFYEKSRRYLKRIFEDMGISEKNLILDQLLVPFNLNRMEHYFEENAECFVVQRDPRDIFISNKYVWTKMNCPIPYPTEVHEFCSMYQKLRAMEPWTDYPHIHKIQFEDLIYRYEEMNQRIQNILGLSKQDHIAPKHAFDPSRSVHNTQLFEKEEYREEMKIIEEQLSGYLYQFPYKREVELDKVF